MRGLFLILFFLLTNTLISAQVGNPSMPPETPYDKSDGGHNKNNRVVPYTYIREADVMFHRRIWRKIDLREKLNLTLYYPKQETRSRRNLISIIRDGVTGAKLTGYAVGFTLFSQDDFQIPLTATEAAAIGNDTTAVPLFDEITGEELGDTLIPSPFAPDKLSGYILKEDWMFEKERSIMEPRIMGLLPIMSKFDQNTGEFKGSVAVFWIYFPELRKLLSREDMYNPYNFSQRMTYDDFFQKRMFSSYIIRVDNVYDRAITDFSEGLDALREADEVKDMLFTFEHDLWEQ